MPVTPLGSARTFHGTVTGWQQPLSMRPGVDALPRAVVALRSPPADRAVTAGAAAVKAAVPAAGARLLSPLTATGAGKGNDMPAGRGGNSLKDPELYEKLRDEGASKEKAARVSNAAARDGRRAVGRRGGNAGDYEDWTVAELRGRAKELGLTGYSNLRKAALIDRLRSH